MRIAIKFGRVGIYNEEVPSRKSQGPLITCSCKITGKLGKVNKPGKLVTCSQKFPPIKSHNSLNIWSPKVI